MLKSVYQNGGFYVGRYEAGIEKFRTDNSEKNSNGKYVTPTATPVTKETVYPYTYVTRTQAQKLAEKVNSGSYNSSLMFGVQWDLVLAFMHNNGNIEENILTSASTTIGNYRESVYKLNTNSKYATISNWTLNSVWHQATTVTENFVDKNLKKISQTSNGNGIIVTTGTSEQNKVMNIYDIAGNVYEWNLENTSIISAPCSCRGGGLGCTGTEGPASFRSYDVIEHYLKDVGFRVSLW